MDGDDDDTSNIMSSSISIRSSNCNTILSSITMISSKLAPELSFVVFRVGLVVVVIVVVTIDGLSVFMIGVGIHDIGDRLIFVMGRNKFGISDDDDADDGLFVIIIKGDDNDGVGVIILGNDNDGVSVIVIIGDDNDGVGVFRFIPLSFERLSSVSLCCCNFGVDDDNKDGDCIGDDVSIE